MTPFPFKSSRRDATPELLYADLNNCEKQENVCLSIAQRNQQNPTWLNQLVKTAIKENKGWLIPDFILIRHWISLTNKPLFKKILLFSLALAAFMLDLWLSVQVNFELSRKEGIGYWKGSGSWGKSAKQNLE